MNNSTASVVGETEDADDDSSIGGDEPFCQHGNLLWSETCDECIEAHWKLSDSLGRIEHDPRLR